MQVDMEVDTRVDARTTVRDPLSLMIDQSPRRPQLVSGSVADHIKRASRQCRATYLIGAQEGTREL